VRCAEYLAQSDDLLREYAEIWPSEHSEDSIMRAVLHDTNDLIALFCLVARKR
jgi:hypothetical protein